MKQEELKMLQALPLDVKIMKSKLRIREWYEYHNGMVYVSVSGGIGSTVLLHIVRQLYEDVPGAYVNTGNEFTKNKNFVKTLKNITWLRPEMCMAKVIRKYGYPVASKKISGDIYKLRHHNLTDEYRNYLLNGDKRGKAGKIPECWKKLLTAPFEVSNKCCDILKKRPLKKYSKKTGRFPFTGEMAAESRNRTQQYLETGCNAYDLDMPKSMPLGFWTQQDILQYLKLYNVPYSSLYGDIVEVDGKLTTTKEKHSGCMVCAFGAHKEPKYDNRFIRLKNEEPRMYDFCINRLGYKEVLEYIGVSYIDQETLIDTNWNEFLKGCAS